MDMNLEKDLLDFLASGKKLEYDYSKTDAGYVGLCAPDELQLGPIYIEGPEMGKSYYSVPAVSLTNENDCYDPDYILLWLPNEMKYGAWDSSNWILYVFNNISWKDIVKNPLPYIDCAFNPDQKVGEEFDPEDKYELIKGWPE